MNSQFAPFIRNLIANSDHLENHFNALLFKEFLESKKSNILVSYANNNNFIKEIQLFFKVNGHELKTTKLYETLSKICGEKNWNVAQSKSLEFSAVLFNESNLSNYQLLELVQEMIYRKDNQQMSYLGSIAKFSNKPSQHLTLSHTMTFHDLKDSVKKDLLNAIEKKEDKNYFTIRKRIKNILFGSLNLIKSSKQIVNSTEVENLKNLIHVIDYEGGIKDGSPWEKYKKTSLLSIGELFNKIKEIDPNFIKNSSNEILLRSLSDSEFLHIFDFYAQDELLSCYLRCNYHLLETLREFKNLKDASDTIREQMSGDAINQNKNFINSLSTLLSITSDKSSYTFQNILKKFSTEESFNNFYKEKMDLEKSSGFPNSLYHKYTAQEDSALDSLFNDFRENRPLPAPYKNSKINICISDISLILINFMKQRISRVDTKLLNEKDVMYKLEHLKNIRESFLVK